MLTYMCIHLYCCIAIFVFCFFGVVVVVVVVGAGVVGVGEGVVVVGSFCIYKIDKYSSHIASVS